MSKNLVIVLVVVVLLGFPVLAHADCCVDGAPTVYTNYTGQLNLAIGGGFCPVNFNDCTIIEYHWKHCEKGAEHPVSFEVVGSPDCDYYVVGVCLNQLGQCSTIYYPNGAWGWQCRRYC